MLVSQLLKKSLYATHAEADPFEVTCDELLRQDLEEGAETGGDVFSGTQMWRDSSNAVYFVNEENKAVYLGPFFTDFMTATIRSTS